jgi:hypothetical protein
MGWGVDRPGKNRVVDTVNTHAVKFSYSQIVNGSLPYATFTDVNAMVRRLFSGVKSSTPRELTAMFIRRCDGPLGGDLRQSFFACDSYHLIPKIRQEFHTNERYAPDTEPPGPNQVVVNGKNYTLGQEPLSDDIVSEITEENMPHDYDRVWSSAMGKKKLMCMISNMIKDELISNCVSGAEYIFDPAEGDVWYLKSTTRMVEDGPKRRYSTDQKTGEEPRSHNYGEADAKVVEAAFAYATRNSDHVVIVHTIDWDMFISGMCMRFPPNIWLHLSDVNTYDEEDDAGVERTIRYARPSNGGPSVTDPHIDIIKRPELINPSMIYSGRDPFSIGFILLAAGGVDYCNSLSIYGIKQDVLIDVACTVNVSFITIAVGPDGKRRAKLDVEGLMSILRERARDPPRMPVIVRVYRKQSGKHLAKVDEIISSLTCDLDRFQQFDDADPARFEVFNPYGIGGVVRKMVGDKVPEMLKRRIKLIRDYEIKDEKFNSIASFEGELDRIWTCFLYYAGFDPLRPRGGVLSQKNDWFLGCETVDDAFEKSHDNFIEYVEEYPYKK